MAHWTQKQIQDVINAWAKAHPKERRLTPKEAEEILDAGKKWEDEWHAKSQLSYAAQMLPKPVARWLHDFARDWQIQAISAMTEATKPQPDARGAWYAALAGNVMWASAAFFPGALLQFGVSITGIAIATPPIPSGDDDDVATAGLRLVGDAVADMRKTMDDAIDKSVMWVVDELIEKFDAAAFQSESFEEKEPMKFVWEKLVFKDVQFRDYKQIKNSLRKSIDSALASFKVQYDQWRQFIYAPVQRPGHGGGRPFSEIVERRKRERPFRPVLPFANTAKMR